MSGAFWREVERQPRPAPLDDLVVYRCTRCRRLGCAVGASLPTQCVCHDGR